MFLPVIGRCRKVFYNTHGPFCIDVFLYTHQKCIQRYTISILYHSFHKSATEKKYIFNILSFAQFSTEILCKTYKSRAFHLKTRPVFSVYKIHIFSVKRKEMRLKCRNKNFICIANIRMYEFLFFQGQIFRLFFGIYSFNLKRTFALI